MTATRDYKPTLNVTLSDKDARAFPQRGNLPEKEPQFQARWAEADVYAKSLAKPAPRGTFVLHDGPPYSNGDIHLGHALNKVAKDITTRFKSMQGYCAPYVPGWDNHGMPIENAVAKRFREEKKVLSRVELRQECRLYAEEWVQVQRGQFQRLGIRGDWANPYLTMSSDFEAKIVEVFGELAQAGFVYRGLKPVLWCATCETALADAEVEYENHVSNSIYVRFPLRYDPNGVFAELPNPPAPFPAPLAGSLGKGETSSPDSPPFPSEERTVKEGGPGGLGSLYAVIWTTTPWTIPANLALAVHPEAEYAVTLVKREEETVYYLVALPLLDAVMKAVGEETYEVLRTVKGENLAGMVFQHPLFHRSSPIVLADYVTMDAGTGIVHTAPGHGKEDFETGQKYGLEVLNPVDPAGRYTPAAGEYDGQKFEGLRVTTVGNKPKAEAEANVVMIEALKKAGNLLNASKFEHSYPHCWRCHSPLVFRATVQWFMDIDHDGHREKALEAIGDVQWVPRESVNRITSMVGGRPDWCVSRQRSWGVGIPAFYCDACGEHILEKESVQAVVELVARESSDAWYEKTPAEILGEDYHCPKCGNGAAGLRKETDVLDVWFDSGSTSRAVLESPRWPNLHWPADVYLEGGDQHRGWFNSSLMIGVATKGKAPYKSVVTNGWTLDEHGKAMHKSLGNVVSPLSVIAKYGADVVRWWVASSDFKEEARCGDKLLEQVGTMYRTIRNTFRFLVNNLYDFDPATDAVPEQDMEELDRWIVAKLSQLVLSATAAYEAYDFHKVYQMTLNFCSVELSAFYLDVLKDRLYASGAASLERRSAQTAMYRVAETLARLLAPILVFTTEEVWEYLQGDKTESVHLADFPTAAEPDADLLARWDKILTLRDMANGQLEQGRKEGSVGKTLEARVNLGLNADSHAELAGYASLLPSLFLVAQVNVYATGEQGQGLVMSVEPAEGVKCARCWLLKQDVGANPAYPDLCARCAGVVATLDAA